MKKRMIAPVFLLFLMAAIFTITATATEIVDSGYCGGEGDGTNLTWTLNSEGTLTISGAGAMKSYSYGSPYSSHAPWYDNRNAITALTISNSVTVIGNCAFYGCSSLTSVTIPNSVTSVEERAFEDCRGLTSITIPNSVTSIGHASFAYCTALTSVTIPNSVTSIGDYAFRSCEGLTSVTIPDSVTSVGSCAFIYCSSLTSVTIANSVTSIGNSAFFDCEKLTSINVESGNTAYSSENGILFNKDKSTLLCYPAGKTETTYVIPDSVTSIGGGAFAICRGLISVTIPNSVTSIGNQAFGYCNGLTSVTIPNSVTSIGDWAFKFCSGLTNVTISNSVTSIGEDTFYECRKLTSVTIPNGVTSIGDCAFGFCEGLTSVTIPNSVTSIGTQAFLGCDGLTSVTIPDSVTSIGSGYGGSFGCGGFDSCDGLTSINVESGNTAYSSENGILFNKDKSTLLCYPTGKTETTYVIPDSVTSIGSMAFKYCSKLTSVTIPASVISIGSDAFYDCSNLTSVMIPSSVTSIGSGAFSSCDGLTSVTISNSVTSIGHEAFQYCRALKDVYYDGTETQWGAITIGRSNDLLTSATIHYSGTISVTLTSVTLNPASVELDGTSETSATATAYDASENMITNGVTWSVRPFGDGVTMNAISGEIMIAADAKAGEYIVTASYNSVSKSVTLTVTRSSGTGGNAGSSTLSFYPETEKVLNLDDPSKGTSATNYLDAKPRIFFDRAVDSYAGRAKLDFSNGTLEIRRSSDDGLVYSVEESAGNPGTSNQMPIWGETSPYTAVRLEDAVSVLDYETEYYVVMPEGFVKFSDGTASPAVKKGDWTFKTAKAPVYRVVQMEEFGDLSVNSSGVAIAWFRIEDENGNPISGATLQYQLNGATAKTVISDGNGLVSVETPRLEKTQEFHVAFSAYKNNLRGIRDIPIVNGEQDFTVTVKALSYTQEWSGTLNTGIGLSEGIGAGIKGGAAKAEADLIQRSMSGDVAQSFSISDEYDDTQRTLTLKTSNSNAQKLKLKSGVDAKMLRELEIVGASGNVKYTNELESGLKIENYDPQNTEQLKQIGAFTLIGVAGSKQSAYLQSLIGLLNPNICNTTSVKSSTALSAEASVLEFKAGISEESNLKVSAASGKGSTVWSWSSSYDSSDHTLDLVKSLKAEVSAGIGSVGIGSKKSETPVSRIIADFNTGDYLKGYSVEGSRSITATHDTQEDKVKGISYKAYLEGESHASLYENATDISVKVSFDEEQTQELLKENAALSLFSKGLNPAINIQDAIRAMHDSGLIAKVTETTELKEGFNFDFPLGVELIIGLEFSFSLSGEMSGSYVDMTAVRYAGNDYVTSIAMIPETYIKANLSDLTALLAEPLKNILSDLKGQVVSAVDAVKDGVSNAYAKVSGRVASWYASIASIPTAELHSMGIMTLMSGNEPDSNAAVSATLGSPYLISIYADETKETLVTNEQLAEHPLTLTLAYTDEMLSLAGASSDSNVMLFSFDSERNLYVYESGGVQDKAQKTVTAQITKNGEYILATDSVAPIITDFKMENQTLTPTLTVLISDLSGLGNFRFWIDNGNDLVTMENIKDHYNSSTGVFTYEFVSALSEGTHTASFLATDNLGNANASPVSFTFEAHPLRGTISITQFPTSAITNRGAFTVKAKSSGVESFSQVNLRCNTGSQILSVLPMTWENDAWTVQVTPVDGAESLALTAIAEDSWGNTITSDSVTVTLNLPRQLEDVQIQNVVYDQGVAQVTVQAPQGLAISGTLFVGVYQNGRQLCIGSGNIGLASGQSNTVPVVLPNFGTEATTIKAFMLSPDEFIPLCAAYTLQL